MGRWFSVDPLVDKYPNISPYAFGLNSPILVLDNDGRANVIYLVLLPSASGEFTIEDAKAIVAKANESLKALGINAEVKLWESSKEGETFNANNLDASDKAVFLGEKGDITNSMIKADIGEFHAKNEVPKLTECGSVSPTPEISELPGDAFALNSSLTALAVSLANSYVILFIVPSSFFTIVTFTSFPFESTIIFPSGSINTIGLFAQ